MFIQSPKEKNKLNLYLNDNNLYVKNSLKMRERHLSYFKENLKKQNEFKKKNPVPKILYSTSDENFHQRRKNIIDQLSPKYAIKDLLDVVNNFEDNFNIDIDEEDENNKEKNENQKTIPVGENKIPKDIKLDNELSKNEKEKNNVDFFLTEKKMFDKKIGTNPGLEILNDLEFANARSTNFPITSRKDVRKIKSDKKMYKTNLYFENYGKYKFTQKGLYYPENLKKYELPNYTGNDVEEKKYFNFRKKIFNPNLKYNKITSFSEKFNKDLGEIDSNYGKAYSRTRFTENPLTAKYMEIIPNYEIYKDLKEIENRYIGSRYKFKLLPLYYRRLYNLDKMADKFYKNQFNKKEGLASIINIQNKSYFNKSSFS